MIDDVVGQYTLILNTMFSKKNLAKNCLIVVCGIVVFLTFLGVGVVAAAVT